MYLDWGGGGENWDHYVVLAVQKRDNSGLLGTPVYYSLKLGDIPPNAQVGGGGGGGGEATAPLPPV